MEILCGENEPWGLAVFIHSGISYLNLVSIESEGCIAWGEAYSWDAKARKKVCASRSVVDGHWR